MRACLNTRRPDLYETWKPGRALGTLTPANAPPYGLDTIVLFCLPCEQWRPPIRVSIGGLQRDADGLVLGVGEVTGGLDVMRKFGVQLPTSILGLGWSRIIQRRDISPTSA